MPDEQTVARTSKRGKRIFGTKVVVNLNAKRGYRANERAERVINLGKMDSATCAAVNGVLNDNHQCMTSTIQEPNDPDVLIIRKMRYHTPGDSMLDRNGLAEASAILKKYEQQDKLQDFVEKKISGHVPSLDKKINELIEAGEILPVFKPKDDLTVKEVKEYKPYSVDWAVRQIEICISKGYEEDLCVGAVLGEVRKKGKYDALDTLFDESIPNDFDDGLLAIIERFKNKYDARYNEKIGFLTKSKGLITRRIREKAINVVYPGFDTIMRRPLIPREELIDKTRPGGEIPGWLYAERDKSGFRGKGKGGRPRLADSIPLSTKEQQEEIEKRFRELTPDEQREFHRRLASNKEKTRYMDSEQKRKYWNEVNRNYYYLNRYGMTEKEYKTRKKQEWSET